MDLKKRPRIAATIPTATMADIAFLLIVFFLVTTSLSHDKGLGLTLPPAGSATRIPARNITKVLIDTAGGIMNDQSMVTLEGLGERIRRMTGENENLIVSIKTAPDTPYEFFVDVVDEVMKAGNDKISIAEPDM